MKNVYMFKDATTIRVQKFDNLKRYEEVEIKLDVIEYIQLRPIIRLKLHRSLNKTNRETKYETSATNLPREFLKMTIEIKQPVGDTDRASPTFGTESTAKPIVQPANGKGNNKLGNDLLSTNNLAWDFTKRQREPAGADGKSQNEFIKMSQMNKNPLGRKVELLMYTLDDVRLCLL